MTNLLRINNLCVNYSRSGVKKSILKGVSVSVNSGEIVGLIGESGSGKTTLIDSFLGIIKFRGAEVSFSDMIFDGMEEKALLHKRAVSYIPQDPAVSFDPLKNINFNFCEIIKLKYGSLPKSKIDTMISESLVKAHLNPEKRLLHSFPHELSGGMKQRILLALALVTFPKLIIADEPTSNLDVLIARKLAERFSELREAEGISFLLATHNIALVKLICSRVYVLFKGEIVEQGESKAVFNEPKHPYTKLLLNGANAGEAEVFSFFERE